jgi:hypothetical protein
VPLGVRGCLWKVKCGLEGCPWTWGVARGLRGHGWPWGWGVVGGRVPVGPSGFWVTSGVAGGLRGSWVALTAAVDFEGS